MGVEGEGSRIPKVVGSGRNRGKLRNIAQYISQSITNAIYRITRTLCKKIYIGETGRRLGDLFCEPYETSKEMTRTHPNRVARHFNHPRSFHRQPKLRLRAAHKLDCFFHAMHNNNMGTLCIIMTSATYKSLYGNNSKRLKLPQIRKKSE